MKDTVEEDFDDSEAAAAQGWLSWHVSDYAEFLGAEIELLAAEPSLGPDAEH
jgi:hypothetical protein